nr:sulfotransferase family protein [Nocardioides perillae]
MPADAREVDAPDPATYPRSVLFIAGAGRSGTSTLAGIASLLGLHVPQPEVEADETNPKGFGEPRWVVEQHDRWLAEVGVTVSDARPTAWFETGRVATREPERIRCAQWLEPHFAERRELVVKDPRLSWFLPLWQIAAARAGARSVFATMLRPPAEVVGSKQKYYANRLGSAHLAASWVNMLLHTERATRGGDGRVFVRYHDLLDDWTKVLDRLGRDLDLRHVQQTGYEQIRDVHRFVDPGLRRVSADLDDLALPRRLHALVGETWSQLSALAEPDGDTEEARRGLDELLEAYTELYEESEAIARSTAVAAADRARREAAATARPTSVVDRVPHGVRAAVPPAVRRGVRRALGQARPGGPGGPGGPAGPGGR